MKESKPKYLEIADAIHQEIRQEIYKQGDKLPVERELQERFGASRMTIRHALQKREQQGVCLLYTSELGASGSGCRVHRYLLVKYKAEYACMGW